MTALSHDTIYDPRQPIQINRQAEGDYFYKRAFEEQICGNDELAQALVRRALTIYQSIDTAGDVGYFEDQTNGFTLQQIDFRQVRYERDTSIRLCQAMLGQSAVFLVEGTLPTNAHPKLQHAA